MGVFSVVEVVAFGCHFLRSATGGEGGVVWEIVGDGSVATAVWIAGAAADAVMAGTGSA